MEKLDAKRNCGGRSLSHAVKPLDSGQSFMASTICFVWQSFFVVGWSQVSNGEFPLSGFCVLEVVNSFHQRFYKQPTFQLSPKRRH
jgi:hypothetical protein